MRTRVAECVDIEQYPTQICMGKGNATRYNAVSPNTEERRATPATSAGNLARCSPNTSLTSNATTRGAQLKL